jgi:hypothetical protein
VHGALAAAAGARLRRFPPLCLTLFPRYSHPRAQAAWLEGRRNVEDMLRVIRLRVMDELRATGPEEHRTRTEADWQSAWDLSLGGTEIMPREYAVDEKFVSGLFRALENDADALSKDPDADLRLWAETHPDDVFYYNAGKKGGKGVRLAYTTASLLTPLTHATRRTTASRSGSRLLGAARTAGAS